MTFKLFDFFCSLACWGVFLWGQKSCIFNELKQWASNIIIDTSSSLASLIDLHCTKVSSCGMASVLLTCHLSASVVNHSLYNMQWTVCVGVPLHETQWTSMSQWSMPQSISAFTRLFWKVVGSSDAKSTMSYQESQKLAVHITEYILSNLSPYPPCFVTLLIITLNSFPIAIVIL